MSLEQALADNTAALRENTAVAQATLKALTAAASTQVAPGPQPAADPPKPARGKAKTAPVEAPTAAPAAPAVNAKTVADAVVDIANTVGRDAAVALLREFGAERASGLKPEHYAAVLERAAALKAPQPAGGESSDSLV